MKKTSILFLCLLAVFFYACDAATDKLEDSNTATLKSKKATVQYDNPAAVGFNLDGSDKRAIEIADSIVLAYGGRKAYDQNRYFKWNFFGVRSLVWDKKDKLVRIDFPSKKAIYLLNYEDMTGRVAIDGKEITAPEELAVALQEARSIWINDSYWLVHQFKLKDSGVTLKYVDDTPVDPEKARPSYIIDQTFAAIGDTPENRYRLYIDKATHQINTWQFFTNAADEEHAMQTPWNGHSEYNGLVLSADRGGRFQLMDIETPQELAADIFSKF